MQMSTDPDCNKALQAHLLGWRNPSCWEYGYVSAVVGGGSAQQIGKRQLEELKVYHYRPVNGESKDLVIKCMEAAGYNFKKSETTCDNAMKLDIGWRDPACWQ
jgi:hypothetical protein